MNEVKLAMDTWVEILPSYLVKLDTGVIDRLEEASLMDELEWLTCDHLAGTHHLEHKRVIAGIRSDIKSTPLAAKIGDMLGHRSPALIVSPHAGNHEVLGEHERALQPGLERIDLLPQLAHALRRETVGKLGSKSAEALRGPRPQPRVLSG